MPASSEHRGSEDLTKESLARADSEREHVRYQIETEGPAATYYQRLDQEDLPGVLFAIEASPGPIPMNGGHIEKITRFKSPELIGALIQSGVPLLSDPQLYLPIIRAEKYLPIGEEPELVKALVGKGIGPRKLRGALTEACDWVGYNGPRLGLRVVETLLSAGVNVHERGSDALCTAFTSSSLWRSPEAVYSLGDLAQLLCCYDRYGIVIRRLLAAFSITSDSSFKFLASFLNTLAPPLRKEALEHALNYALQRRLTDFRNPQASRDEAVVFTDLLTYLWDHGARGNRVVLHDRFCSGERKDDIASVLRYLGYAHHHVSDLGHNHIRIYEQADSDFSSRKKIRGPLEEIIRTGDFGRTKDAVENHTLSVNENNGIPLISACQNGWVDIVEYLISKGADPHAQNESPLVEAARYANAEVIRILLERGCDLHVDDDYPIYLCACNPEEVKQGPALESAKYLVEHGAPPRVFGLPMDLHRGPAPRYLFLMSEVLDPLSDLHIRTIEPRFTKEHINVKDRFYRRSHAFKYISNCAAVAASIGDISIAREFFVSFLRDGAHKVFEEKKGRFENLAEASSRELDGYQDLSDVCEAFSVDVLFPLVLAQSPQHHGRVPKDIQQQDVLKAVHTHLYPEAVRILLKDRPLLEILRFNRLWHRSDKRIPLGAHPLRADAFWYPLIPETYLSNGFSIHPLTDNDALAREGAALHHCVGKGAYASECLSGESHLLSLRYNSEPVATMQFSDSNGRKTDFPLGEDRFVTLAQFRGAYNHAVDNAAQRAFEEFKQLVISKRVVLRSGVLGETQESMARRKSSGISTLESVTGIRLGEFPTDAIRHYRELTIFPTKSDKEPRSRGTPMLRGEKLSLRTGVVEALFDELASRKPARVSKILNKPLEHAS